MISLHPSTCLVGVCCALVLCAACASSSPEGDELALTSSPSRVQRFTPEMLPSESWRHALHVLDVQPMSSEIAIDHARLTVALELAGHGEAARASITYAYDRIQEADLPDDERSLMLALYEMELDALRPQFEAITPAAFRAMTPAERRALLREPLGQMALVEPVTEAMMSDSSSRQVGLDGERLETLLRRVRLLVEQGERDEAETLLLMHEPEVDMIRALPRWIRARSAWHAAWRELGQRELVERNLESPLYRGKKWTNQELAVLAAWRCEQWLALDEPERALGQCKRALGLYPERFRQQPSLSTQVDRLPDALIDSSVQAALTIEAYRQAERYASWHVSLAERERLHATIFETMMARGHHGKAVEFARELLDDRDLLVAVTRYARANPDDAELEAQRLATWTLFEGEPDKLYVLDQGPNLERQLSRLLEILSFKQDEGAAQWMTFAHIIDAIDRMPSEDEHLRAYVLLATLVDPSHPGHRGLVETIRDRLPSYMLPKNAQGVAALHRTDRVLFAHLIERAASDEELATLLFAQLENAADAGQVLAMIERDDALRALPESWRAETSARLLDLPVLHAPTEYVTLGAQLMRLFDDERAWEQVEAHIFARRRSAAVSAEQLRTLYATWFERKLALGTDFIHIEALIGSHTLPRERDVMSAAIVDVLYERPWLDDVLSSDELGRVASWRDTSSKSLVYDTKLAALHARHGDCDHTARMPAKTLRAFPPALPTLVQACRDQVPTQTWHAWIETRQADRHRFGRELLFALIYEP